MSTTTLISLIVVVVAFALFFYLSFKGVNLFLTVFACTLLVSFCTPDGITSIFTAFLPSVGTMFQQFLLLYTIGGLRLLPDGERPRLRHGDAPD